VIQRVTEAAVRVEDEVIGAIGPGLLALVGVEVEDTDADARYIVEKIAGLRIFNDTDGKFNLSLADVNGSVLVVSQFTLHGDCRKGRRPSFIDAARPEHAIPLYESVADQLRAKSFEVATGSFGANMQVSLVNDGPVTILLDSRKNF
jgi:D-tyrosyl-tRNA(Tyr) deacylase